MAKIFDNVIPDPTPRPEPDPIEVKKARLVEAVNADLRNGLGTIVNVHNQIVRRVNFNEDGLTPTQAAAAFGTDGGALLFFAGKVAELASMVGNLQGASNQQVAAMFLPHKQGVSYSAGQDGRLIVTEDDGSDDDE